MKSAKKILLWMFVVLLFVACGQKKIPEAKKGVLDLRHWDFVRDGNIPLSGQWEFYWKQFKSPEDFLWKEEPSVPNYIDVPSPSWISHREQEPSIKAHGYATYRLKVLLPDYHETKELSLKLKDVATAYRLFADDVLLVSVGKVGTSVDETEARYETPVRTFLPRSNIVNIIVHVSNFHYSKAGLWESFLIGNTQKIHQKKLTTLSYDFFLMGVLVIMFFYHLGFFFLRKKETSYLLFALFTLVFALRVMTRGEIFLSTLFPNISFAWQVRAEYLSFYIAVPLFYTFLYFAFRGSFRPWVLKMVLTVTTGFSLVVLFTPPTIFTKTINYYQLTSLFIFGFIFYGMIRAIKNKRMGAITTFIGTFVFSLTAVNDILYLNGISPIPEISPFGSFIFIFSQSLVLSIQFSKAYKNAETLSNYLERLNKANSRFVPTDVLKFLNKDSIVDIRLGDTMQKNMSILVSDIRNFTGISESLTPNQNFAFINSYLGYVSPVVRRHSGFVDAYLGDGILALFPQETKDVVAAAIEMQKEIKLYNTEEKVSLPRDIKVGVGIHKGSLMLGTIGESERISATVISDAVSTAFRMEVLTKKFGVSIIVSEPIKKDSIGYTYRILGTIKIQKEPVFIYEVLDVCEEEEKNLKLKTLASFENAVNFFIQKKYIESKQLFSQVLQVNHRDKAALYYMRFFEYKKVG